MIRRDIHPQWQNIADWYWAQYHRDNAPRFTIWDILERDYGAMRTRSMGMPGWSVIDFPDEQSYTMFLLRWT